MLQRESKQGTAHQEVSLIHLKAKVRWTSYAWTAQRTPCKRSPSRECHGHICNLHFERGCFGAAHMFVGTGEEADGQDLFEGHTLSKVQPLSFLLVSWPAVRSSSRSKQQMDFLGLQIAAHEINDRSVFCASWLCTNDSISLRLASAMPTNVGPPCHAATACQLPALPTRCMSRLWHSALPAPASSEQGGQAQVWEQAHLLLGKCQAYLQN